MNVFDNVLTYLEFYFSTQFISIKFNLKVKKIYQLKINENYLPGYTKNTLKNHKDNFVFL